MRHTFQLATSLVGMDIMTGGELWTRYRDFELDELEDLIETNGSPGAIQDAKRRLLGVIRKQLAHPLLGNETALAELDDMLANVCVQSDVSLINPSVLSDLFSAGVEAREARLVFEENVSSPTFPQRTPTERETGWRAYIAFEIKDNKLLRAQRLYDRAVQSCPRSLPLWRDYIHFTSSSLKSVQLLRAVTSRSVRVRPECTSDVDIWRLRFFSLEQSEQLTSPCAPPSVGEIGPAPRDNGGEAPSEQLPAQVFATLQRAMGCVFPRNEDYLTIMQLYCDCFRRSLSRVMVGGAAAGDVLAALSALTAAMDFVESYLWTYFDKWVEGWTLFALYRCRVEEGVVEDIACSVDGEIDGTPVASKAVEVWDRILSSPHGRAYVVWKAVLLWAVASRKDTDYVRKLFKKAVGFVGSAPVSAIQIDGIMGGRSAIVYNASSRECPLETLFALWVAYEEEVGTVESAQQIVNRRYRVLGGDGAAPAPEPRGGEEGKQSKSSQRDSKDRAVVSSKQLRGKEADKWDAEREGGQHKRLLSESTAGGTEVPREGGMPRVTKKARKEQPVDEGASHQQSNADSAASPRGDDVDLSKGGERYSIFVKNLAFSARECDIRAVFEDCGPLSGLEVLTNTSGKSKGMALLHFSTSAAAEKALLKHNSPVAGRPVAVEAHRGEGSSGGQGGAPSDAYHPTTIFVTKLPRDEEVCEDELRGLFEEVAKAAGGDIEACVVVKDKRSKHCKVRRLDVHVG